MRIAMIGSGYVGLVSGACFSDFGHTVTCVDLDEGKIAALRGGVMPIYEPGLKELVERNAREGRLSFSTDLASSVAGVEAVFIAVGTPSRHGDGHADLSYVYAAARDVALAATGPLVVITKSTVPVGTGDEVERIVREARPDMDIAVVSNPEFLREGAAIEDFKRPDRVVVGVEKRARQGGDGGHLPAAVAQQPADGLRRAAHLRAHQIRGQRLSRGQDHLYQRDRRPLRGDGRQRAGGGARHRPRQAHRLQVPACRTRLWRLVLSQGHAGTGQDRPGSRGRRCASSRRLSPSTTSASGRWAARSSRRAGAPCAARRWPILGLAFKPNTDDMREAPALAIVTALQDAGATVRGFDPEGMEQARPMLPGMEFAANAYDCVSGADAVAIVTEWDEFRALDLERIKGLLKAPVLVDLRNIYLPEEVTRHGFNYSSVGRPGKRVEPA